MKKIVYSLPFIFLLPFFLACGNDDKPAMTPPENTPVSADTTFLKGADLSYVNEMLDCGAVYYNEIGEGKDPYVIFKEAGADLVRVRLWHNPTWTAYSNEVDVRKTIAKAKAQNLKVLLDFHYSDDWSDPGKQVVPAAWLPVVDNTSALGDSIYNYTYRILSDLATADLLPEIVQVGNEINSEILQNPNAEYQNINWNRNAALLNKGIKAVRDASNAFGKEIEIMLHIAQPENALWWFEQAKNNGIENYDWIGISYYPLWSSYTMTTIPAAMKTLVETYDKKLMIVETAYPFTLENADAANNILGADAAADEYPISPQGQYDYLKALSEKVKEAGGQGLVYWEPAWVSTSCSTQWAQGSHWDNATLFDHNNRATVGMEFYNN